MKYQDDLDGRALAQYAAWLNARAKSFGSKERLNAALLRDRILDSAGRCEWCNAGLVGSGFELDHIISLRQGGSNEPANLVVACPSCNRRKAKKPPAQFAAEVYSESGVKTKLVTSLLKSGGVDAGRQTTMFDETPSQTETSVDARDDLSIVSPYDWTD